MDDLVCFERIPHNTCSGVPGDLSRSIALQRSFSTVCLTVSVWSDARQNKRLSGSEMIEWE
jgi:hypothetical protein